MEHKTGDIDATKVDIDGIMSEIKSRDRAAVVARDGLTAEAQRFIGSAYGDVSTYLANKIEAEVRLQK